MVLANDLNRRPAGYEFCLWEALDDPFPYLLQALHPDHCNIMRQQLIGPFRDRFAPESPFKYC